MKKVVQIFRSFEQADQADREYYRSLTPQQRLDLALELYDRHFDASKQRLERVCRVIKPASRPKDLGDASLLD